MAEISSTVEKQTGKEIPSAMVNQDTRDELGHGVRLLLRPGETSQVNVPIHPGFSDPPLLTVSWRERIKEGMEVDRQIGCWVFKSESKGEVSSEDEMTWRVFGGGRSEVQRICFSQSILVNRQTEDRCDLKPESEWSRKREGKESRGEKVEAKKGRWKDRDLSFEVLPRIVSLRRKRN